MQIISTVYAATTPTPINIKDMYNPSGVNIPLTTSLSGLLTLSTGVNILNLIFVFTGLFFFVNLVMAGWDFMMSSGDAKKVSAASSRITNGFIGLVMAITAFIVVRIITTMLGLGVIV